MTVFAPTLITLTLIRDDLGESKIFSNFLTLEESKIFSNFPRLSGPTQMDNVI